MARESVQRKLERVRPPRVKISYETEMGAAIETREIPFVIGVLSDLAGRPSQPLALREREFIDIDLDSFNDVVAKISPNVHFKISSPLTGGEIEVDLTFRAIEDFEPDNLINRHPILANLRNSLSPESDEMLQRHLDRVLHAPEFQQIEAAWRSLWYLVLRTETGAQLRIKVLPISKRELLRDFQRSAEFDQTRLFKLVYEGPYGAFGSDPFGILIGNFAFDASAADLELLAGLGRIASACHAPFIAAVAPTMFDTEDFQEIFVMRDLSRTFDSNRYVSWNAFRRSEDARFVGLTLPHVLLRSPYGIRPNLPGEFRYEEQIVGREHLLWGNAAFAFGVCVANSFSRFGWCGAIRGVEGGGLVEGLPTWISRIEDGSELRTGVEIAITDRQEKEFADLGFLPLTQVKNSDFAVFFNSPSCCEPKQYSEYSANANSRLSCQLQYVLTGSCFMHYLKVMARDVRGSYVSASDWERRFNRWISQYVNVDDMASPSIRAHAPLREARIDVVEAADKPGTYRVVAFLRPYFQMEELSVSLRFVGFIP